MRDVNPHDEHDATPASGLPNTKWGDAVTRGRNGYQVLPDVLLRNQHRLGLNCTDMVVLINILMHWWEKDRKSMPHPRPEQIASRIGATPRTVQRSIRRLSEVGLLKWMPPERSREGLSVRRFDVNGLVIKLRALAREVEASEREVQFPLESAV
jgi:DNA-binding MarR family transcriptional regulator